MRLSESLLGKILGKSGRVTCRECASKIQLDATLGQVRVTLGGRLVTDLEIEELLDFTEAPPSVDPHLSELPLAQVSFPGSRESSVPPPLPVEARAQSLRAGISQASGLSSSLHASMRADRMEAPIPNMVGGGSLSPLSLDDDPLSLDDDDDGLVPLGREFNSSPFASERDQSYNSLFPRAERKTLPLDLEAPVPSLSHVPAAYQVGAARRLKSDPDLFSDEISTAPAVAATVVEMGPDGQLINQADKKLRRAGETRARLWIPWTVAATALLGLLVSVSFDRHAPVVIQAPEPSVRAAASEPEKPSAAVKEENEETEPAAAIIEAREVTLVASLPQVNSASSSAAHAEPASKDEVRPLDADAPAGADADGRLAGTEGDDEAEEPELSPFSAAAAASALREATALAGACRKLTDPSGIAKVVVTFAPSGRVTRAAVTGAPFAGTETGGCIASRFRTARVPAFAGEHVTVTKTVTIQ